MPVGKSYKFKKKGSAMSAKSKTKKSSKKGGCKCK